MPFGHVRHPNNTYLATFRLLGAAAGQLLDRPPHRARGDAESLRAFQTGKWGRLHRWGVGQPRPEDCSRVYHESAVYVRIGGPFGRPRVTA